MKQPMSSQTRTGRKKIIVRALALIVALIVGAGLYDLFIPRTTRMREFDPDEVARLAQDLIAGANKKPRPH